MTTLRQDWCSFTKELNVAEMKNEDEVDARGVTRHVLCGVQGCCPTVEVNHNTGKVIIKDDFGGTVTLTKDEWCDALQKVKL